MIGAFLVGVSAFLVVRWMLRPSHPRVTMLTGQAVIQVLKKEKQNGKSYPLETV